MQLHSSSMTDHSAKRISTEKTGHLQRYQQYIRSEFLNENSCVKAKFVKFDFLLVGGSYVFFYLKYCISFSLQQSIQLPQSCIIPAYMRPINLEINFIYKYWLLCIHEINLKQQCRHKHLCVLSSLPKYKYSYY